MQVPDGKIATVPPGNAKNSKRTDRKHKKCQHILEKETGVICSTGPTTYLGVCNAGLVNGLSEETLVEHFIKYGNIKSVMMLPGKSCCFVEFIDLNQAVEAYENINGKLNIAQDKKPLYLAYVESAPSSLKHNYFCETPPGLIIIHDFITESEEKVLLSLNDFEVVNAATLKNRQVKHYGFEFRYDINNVDKDRPLENGIPNECDFLWERLKSSRNVDFLPDQLTINHYKPGHGIPSHIDTHSAFEDPLISLSLGSGVVMEFKHEDGRHIPVFLPQRSLAIMSEESRYDWTHGIVPRKMDVIPTKQGVTVFHRRTRTSFTFRKVREGDCNCGYIKKCDSYSQRQKTIIGDEIASKLESAHVHEVYENIASHFSDTRHKPWPNVLSYVNSLQTGSLLVDVGCGNGKYLGHNKNIYEVGCDRSFNLIDLCSSRGFEVFTCNCLKIPMKDGVADGAISIAVIHHLASEERRLLAIKEIVRVLRIGGTALIYVWAKDQCRNDKSTYIKQDRKNRKGSADILPDQKAKEVLVDGVSLPVHTNRKQFQHQDMLVPWKLKKEDKTQNFLRFYHVFEEGELEVLCKRCDDIKISKSYYDQGNWCVIVEKIK